MGKDALTRFSSPITDHRPLITDHRSSDHWNVIRQPPSSSPAGSTGGSSKQRRQSRPQRRLYHRLDSPLFGGE